MNPMVEYSDSGGALAALIGVALVIGAHVAVGIWALGVCLVRSIRDAAERSRETPTTTAESETPLTATYYVPKERRDEESLQRLISAVCEPREIPEDLRELLGPAKRRD